MLNQPVDRVLCTIGLRFHPTSRDRVAAPRRPHNAALSRRCLWQKKGHRRRRTQGSGGRGNEPTVFSKSVAGATHVRCYIQYMLLPSSVHVVRGLTLPCATYCNTSPHRQPWPMSTIPLLYAHFQQRIRDSGRCSGGIPSGQEAKEGEEGARRGKKEQQEEEPQGPGRVQP